jgi:hypothetical protein
VELAHGLCTPGVDGLGTHAQLGGDLLVGHAASQEVNRFAFPRVSREKRAARASFSTLALHFTTAQRYTV